jgi:hypothetical protein
MDPNKILIWNVHGLNSSGRQDLVCTLVEESHVDVVCIQATKIASMPQRILLSALGTCFLDFLELPAVGACGAVVVS